MANKVSSEIQGYIDRIDLASTGESLREALLYVFGKLQSTGFQAKTLGGYYPSDFITRKRLKALFTEGYVLDSVPKAKSKKAVQSGGVADLFGDLAYIRDNYDKIVKYGY